MNFNILLCKVTYVDMYVNPVMKIKPISNNLYFKLICCTLNCTCVLICFKVHTKLNTK